MSHVVRDIFLRRHPVWFVIAAALLALGLAAYALSKPKYGWDVTTYIGCVHHFLEGESWAETHDWTYRYLAERFPGDVFTEMTRSPPGISPYRSIIATDPEAYRQRLSASCYKVGFLAPVIALTAAGMDPYLAARVTAAIPAAVFLMIAVMWSGGRAPAWQAVLFAILGAFAGLLQTARYEYPDGMTALFIGAALILFCESRLRAACALFLLAMIVRADAILYFGMFLFYATFIAAPSRRIRFLEAVPWGLAALGIWATITGFVETPTYAQAFHHSFISNAPYILDLEPDLSLPAYLEVLIRQIGVVAGKSWKYPALILMAVTAAALSWKREGLRPLGDVALVSLLMVTFHFLFIPWFDTRYYAAPYFLIVVCFGIVASARITERMVARKSKDQA